MFVYINKASRASWSITASLLGTQYSTLYYFVPKASMASISVLLLLSYLLLIGIHIKGAQSVGVCYGKLGDNLPSDREVIDLYKSNGIGQMRIYGPDRGALDALRGSNIELIVDVPKSDLQSTASDAAAAAGWVNDNIKPFSPDVKFKYLAVGNEIKPSDAESKFVLQAMQNLRTAVASAGLQDQLKVSTAIDMSLIGKSFPPADGVFSDAAKPYIEPIVRFLADSGSPLLANVYPYFAHIGNKAEVPLSYALFTATPSYRSLFDAQVDAVYAALEKSGGGGVGIVVSESGWPSEGGDAATHENAQTYYQKLIEHVKGGTVKKPGPLETYLFAMFDENRKDGAETEKHFGVFSPNKQPKYQISFS